MPIFLNPDKVSNGDQKAGSATAKCNQNCKNCLHNKLIKMLKLEEPFDKEGKLVNILAINKKYEYKVTEFNREIKQDDLKKLKWVIQFDGETTYTDYPSLNGKRIVSLDMANLLKSKEKKIRLRVYAYFDKPSEDISIIRLIEGQYPKLYISTQRTGYTIQKLYGHPNASPFYGTYEPAVVVETYKAYLKFYNNGVTTDIMEFNVTRDSWYYLGEENGKAYLLNRTFEPQNSENNMYLTEEIHFPSKAPDDIRGYFLLQNGSRKIKAEPLEKEKDIKSEPIKDKRDPNNIATNVMLHIGGIYRAGYKGFYQQWLGSSLGCFSFIPKNDIYSTKLASKNDDDSTNSHWIEVTNKINELRKEDVQERFFIIINERNTWIKTKTID